MHIVSTLKNYVKKPAVPQPYLTIEHIWGDIRPPHSVSVEQAPIKAFEVILLTGYQTI